MKCGDRGHATATDEANRSGPDHRFPRRGPKEPPMTKRAEKSAGPLIR